MVTKNYTITVMVPAYNEERHLEATIKDLDGVLKKLFRDYEILIFDDGSSDNTPQIADRMSKEFCKVRVVHNPGNKGLGYSYRAAVNIAQKDYFTWIAGDNDLYKASLEGLLNYTGKAEVVIGFTANKAVRPKSRQVISNSYTWLLNSLFNLNIKYYNGGAIYKTELLRKVKMKTNSFAFQAEILIQVLKQGHSYIEVPIYIKGVKGSKIFRMKNIIGIVVTIIGLLFLDKKYAGTRAGVKI